MAIKEIEMLEQELFQPVIFDAASVREYKPLSGCSLNRRIAEAQGYIENYEKYSKCFDDMEPTYLNHPEILGKYAKPIAKDMREFFGKNIGKAPYQKDLKIAITKLPTTYQVLWKMYTDGKNASIKPVGIKPVGKIFGYFNPDANEIGIDPAVFPELNDPERKYLKGMEIPDASRTLGEELFHHGQKKTGIMEAYIKKFGPDARKYIEGQAAHYSDQKYGSTKIYPEWKDDYRKLMDRYGEKKALEGCFNCFCAS